MLVHSFTITQENYLQARTGQLIVGENKALHLSELPDLGWDAACQRIFRHKTVSGILVYHATKTLQAHTGNLIVGGVKLPQLGELPNLGWDGACQRISRPRLVGGRHSCLLQ